MLAGDLASQNQCDDAVSHVLVGAGERDGLDVEPGSSPISWRSSSRKISDLFSVRVSALVWEECDDLRRVVYVMPLRALFASPCPNA
jgi:hypothetical protein